MFSHRLCRVVSRRTGAQLFFSGPVRSTGFSLSESLPKFGCAFDRLKPELQTKVMGVRLILALFLVHTAIQPLCAAETPSTISNIKSQIASPQLATVSAFPQKAGDLDGDGRATVLDLVRLINHLNGTVPLHPDLLLVADVNQDTVVDNADVTADRKSTRLNSSHRSLSRMPSSA